MNKLFIVILAVCLVSVHSALVKRETETATPNYFEDLQKRAQAFADSLKNEVAGALNPEQIKKNLNEGIDNLNKLLTDFTKQGGAKQ